MKTLKKFHLNEAKKMTVSQMKDIKAGYGWSQYGCVFVSCSNGDNGYTDFPECHNVLGSGFCFTGVSSCSKSC